jgi:hypothetical protein
VLWNWRDDRVPWVRALFELVGGEDRFTALDEQGAPDFGPRFAQPETGRWKHAQTLSVEDLLGLVGSYSYVRLRADRDEVMAAVRDLATTHPDLRGGDITLPYVTRAHRAQVLRS